jgi:glycosyltransferase involved in cell wall biosynthesis
VPHKGQRHLIDAAALVVRQVPDARFLIAGEGELRPALERQRPDVLSLHKSFDLFVLSSTTEGLGTSLLDAMACEKAIVATRAGGIPEVVEDGVTGLVVPPKDHDALARAIVRLLKDRPLRAKMAAAGLARVRERFSAERMVQDTLTVYQRVAQVPHREDAM